MAKSILCIIFRQPYDLTMRYFLLCCILISSHLANAQFDPVMPQSDGLTANVSVSRLTDQGDHVLLMDKQLHHMTKENGEYRITKVENTISQIHDFILADANQDGVEDILAYSLYRNRLDVYVREGDHFVYDTEAWPWLSKIHQLHYEDFDGDGKKDIMINHRIYTFPERESIYRYALGNDYKYLLTKFIDFDLDGDKDILLHQIHRLHVIENNGGEFIASSTPLPETNNATLWARTIQTVNGEKLFYYDKRLGIKSMKQIVFTGGGAYEIKDDIDVNMSNGEVKAYPYIKDLDQDGNDEIIIHHMSTGSIKILSYNPDADTLQHYDKKFTRIALLALSGEQSDEIIAGDATKIITYKYQGDTLAEVSRQVTSFEANGSFHDINGDGFTDIINKPGLSVRPYLGEGNFGDIEQVNFPDEYALFEDVDGDGDLDLLGPDYYYINEDGFTYGMRRDTMLPEDPTPDPEIFFTTEIFRHDLDLDGDLDILTYNIFGEPLQLLENNNNINFLEPVTIATSADIGGKLYHISAHDKDNDGDLDIMMGAVSGAITLENQGGLNFSPAQQIYDGDYKVLSMDVDDIDDDGFFDVVVGTREIIAGTALGETILYKGSSDGFQRAYELNTDSNHKVQFADIDGQEWKDIVIHSSGLLRWVSLSETEKKTHLIEDEIPGDEITVIDVNDDDDMDIIVYESGKEKVTYYLNKDIDISDDGCPIGDVYLRSQAELTEYAAKYGSCEAIPGSLLIGNDAHGWSDINNISALKNIKRVEGDLSIRYNNKLSNLSGLQSLESVGGDFNIVQWKSSSFFGIYKLRKVEGDFSLKFINPVLSTMDLSDFISLDTIGGNVLIESSDITSIEAIIQPVFYGDLQIYPNFDFGFSADGMELIDTIYGALSISNAKMNRFDQLKDIDYVGEVSIRSLAAYNVAIADHIKSIPGHVKVYLRGTSLGDQSFSALEHIGGDCRYSGYNLSSFENLISVDSSFQVFADSLSDEAFAKLKTVGTSIQIDIDAMEDFSNFEAIEAVNGSLSLSGNNITSFYPFASIDHIKGDFTIGPMNVLNTLTELNEELIVDGTWNIYNNAALNFCNVIPICNHLKSGKELDLWNNGFYCDELSRIECISNSISGTIFHDQNRNGIHDDNEATLDNIHVFFNDEDMAHVTDHTGRYVYYLAEGDSLSVDVVLPENWATTQERIKIDSFIPNRADNAHYDFGIFPEYEERSLELDVSQSLFLCDRPYDLFVNVMNDGTETENYNLTIDYPEGVKLDTSYTDFIEHDEELGLLTIASDTLYPFFSKSWRIPFVAPSAETLGDLYETGVEVKTLGEDPIEKAYSNSTILLCSYDPNDKLVESTNGTKDLYIDEMEQLYYTIRFQNTGNYYAENVRLTDTLSEQLDLSTFRFISSSHPVEISMQERDRVLYFNFPQINLPDSTRDVAGSQGYVKFVISPVAGLSLGDEINNKAEIYFDYNDAIITNTVKTEVIEVVATKDPLSTISDIAIYPNPVRNYFIVESNSQPIDRIDIYDAQGQHLYTTPEQQVDVHDLNSGIYFCRIWTGGTHTYRSFVKQ